LSLTKITLRTIMGWSVKNSSYLGCSGGDVQ
jgi:hypothetical protein